MARACPLGQQQKPMRAAEAVVVPAQPEAGAAAFLEASQHRDRSVVRLSAPTSTSLLISSLSLP